MAMLNNQRVYMYIYKNDESAVVSATTSEQQNFWDRTKASKSWSWGDGGCS